MKTMRNELLKVENINKFFPGVHAVRDVNLTVYSNEILGICGENGAGKSTLLKIFGGIYQADSGKMYFNGENVHYYNPYESADAGISIIHQELSYLNDLSVAENIYQGMLPVKRFGIIDWKRLYADAEKVFKQYEIDIDVKLKMKDLSVASKQLVEIIKAVCRDSSLVIMDEPTSSLGPTDVPKLFKIVRLLIEANRTVIFISHRLEELFELCDRLIVLCDGMITAEFEKGHYDKMEVVSKMVGRQFEQLYPKEDIEKGMVRLKVEGLYTDKLEDISLEIRAGEITALYGMVGSGQDLILEAIFGLSDITKGNIYLDGEKIDIRTSSSAIEKGIAYVPAERKKDGLISNHSVAWNIVLASLKDIAPNRWINYKIQSTIAQKWIKELSIKTAHLNTIIDSLSGGNQQKSIIARWLQTSPTVFLLNDMTRGVDVGAKYELYTMIQDLCKQGASVLMITSDMLELLSVADKVYTLCENKISAMFLREEFDQNAIMYAAIGQKKG